MKAIASALFGSFLAVFVIGCGGAGSPGPKTDLEQSELLAIHEMYMYFVKATDSAPKGVADLKKYETLLPHGMRALQENKYIVNWGVKDKNPGTVLAYEKTAGKEGTAAVMADGAVKVLSAAELQAAPKK